MKKLFVAAALIAAAAWAGPINANEMHKQGDVSKSSGIELGTSKDSSMFNRCLGNKTDPGCLGHEGKAADGGEQRLGISPPLESTYCNDRPADITDPNCNRPDMAKPLSGK
jgi:hypothetical protein